MCENPYKYEDPLDPVTNKSVCVPRKDHLDKIIMGMRRGEYWALLGPRKSGKTTFLHQIRNNFTNAHILYFNFDTHLSIDDVLYQIIIDKFLEKIPSKPLKKGEKEVSRTGSDPIRRFHEFLEKFKPKEDKKIFLLFDEICEQELFKSFLRRWRTVFHERDKKKSLNRYSVIITGSMDLIEINIGPTSPFNIAQTIELRDFSKEESEKLIDAPFKEYNIKFEPNAKKKLLSQINGHPQMLQHACHILFETAQAEKANNPITKKHVDDAISHLLRENSCLITLEHAINDNDVLKNLLRDILKGQKIKYYPYKKFSIAAAGPIIEDKNGFCTLRNEVYKKFLEKILQISTPKQKPKIFISYSHEDERWKNLLAGHLNVLEYEKEFYVWDDSKINTSQDWLLEIEKNMNSADIAIFLISWHSLTSKFIRSKEIPILLKRRKEEGMIFFPVLVGHCAWDRIEWLAKIQIWPSDGVPISKGRPDQRDKRCVELINELLALLKKVSPMP